MKRYRNEQGHLTVSINELFRLTAAEAREYYQHGAMYAHQGRVYALNRYTDRDAHGEAVEMAVFESADGYRVFTDPDHLGSVLPDVASDGLEFTRI